MVWQLLLVRPSLSLSSSEPVAVAESRTDEFASSPSLSSSRRRRSRSQGYLPAPLSRRATTLARKRSEYAQLVRQAFSRGVTGLDGPIWHQISIDVPRTRPGVKLWMAEPTQRSLERVLYVWAIRHPASGYVQGINDLVTPFFQVFLQSYIGASARSSLMSTSGAACALESMTLLVKRTDSLLVRPQMPTPRRSTCRRSRPRSSRRSRPTRSGACPSSSTASRTTTSLRSRASSASSRRWTVCAHVSTVRLPRPLVTTLSLQALLGGALGATACFCCPRR